LLCSILILDIIFKKLKENDRIMNKIKKIYEILFEGFGAQGWWPVTPIGGCKGDVPDGPIYGIALKNEKQKLEIIFGAILTQNTSWKNVEKAMIELNKENLIDVNKIKKIEKGKLAKIIKSSGYHNQKAEKLKIFSEFLSKKYKGIKRRIIVDKRNWARDSRLCNPLCCRKADICC